MQCIQIIFRNAWQIHMSYPDKIGGRRSNWKFWRKNIEADIAAVLQYKEWEVVATHNVYPDHLS